MADVFSKEKRSEVMSHIKGKGNKKTELALIQLMREDGITGWRRHQNLYGKPDFVFRKERLAVFVDGCFWHGCPKCYQRPATNQEFWDNKIGGNKKRDRKVSRTLRKQGWHVMRIWEHSLKENPGSVVSRLKRMLAKNHISQMDG